MGKEIQMFSDIEIEKKKNLTVIRFLLLVGRSRY